MTLNEKPSESGWYAISYCFDVMEGLCCGASFWDGERWNPEYPVGAYAGTFENKEEAEKWAYDNDIDF